jgi:hypothetical protein
MTPLSVGYSCSWIFLLSTWSVPITSRLTPPQPRVLTRFPQAQGVKPHSVPCEESNTTVERRTERGEAINLSPSLAPNENAEEPHKAKKILVTTRSRS